MDRVRVGEPGLAGVAVRVGVGGRGEDGADRGGFAPGQAVGEDADAAEGDQGRQGRGGDGEGAAGRGGAGAAERALDEGPGRPGQEQRGAAEGEEHEGVDALAEAEAGEGEQRLVPEIGAVADQADADRGRAGEEALGEAAGAGEADDQRSAEGSQHDRQDAGQQAERHGGHRGDDRAETDQGERAAGGGPEGGAGQRHGEAGAEQELPGAERQQEEAGGGARAGGAGGQREAGGAGDRQDRQEPRPAPAPERRQRQGEDQVELLLDAEAPGVEQRQQVGIGAEIVELLPEEQVRDRERGGDEAAGEIAEREGRHPGQGEGDAGQQHHYQGRQDATGAALVEAGDREAAGGEVADQDAADQVAGDHEEDVDAEVAASEGGEAGVEQDHRQHGDRAQAVDLAAPGMGGDVEALGQRGVPGYAADRRCIARSGG